MTDKNCRELALFDFDGTITTVDTLFLFLKFYGGKRRFIFGITCALPVFALYALKVIPNWKAKEYVLKWFLKDQSLAVFREKCHEFSTRILPAVIRPAALQCIEGYQAKGTRVMVVTASAEDWVAPWCSERGIECIGTRLEVKESRLTGKLDGKNCHGMEKVSRIKEILSLEHYLSVHAYGDSKGDLPMLKLASLSNYRPFRVKGTATANRK